MTRREAEMKLLRALEEPEANSRCMDVVADRQALAEHLAQLLVDAYEEGADDYDANGGESGPCRHVNVTYGTCDDCGFLASTFFPV